MALRARAMEMKEIATANELGEEMACGFGNKVLVSSHIQHLVAMLSDKAPAIYAKVTPLDPLSSTMRGMIFLPYKVKTWPRKL